MGALHLTEQNFDQEVLQAKGPVLVDFWAEWCGPCRMMGPIIDAAAEELTGQIKVGKLNVDESQALAGQYGIMSIPSLLIFKNGQVVDQSAGAMAKDALIAKLKKFL